ncbi:predicted protein [Botrytis cinerea T4]|uniref:Uncharacterized protein n=1 Tax=Botryotinia fuckeliana (strain T4) TaxID=999810 RepID=G2XNU6_BOTF4|nr:predicted protein [Botrytis cinerea T4]
MPRYSCTEDLQNGFANEENILYSFVQEALPQCGFCRELWPSSPEIDQQESKSSTVAHSNESIPPIPLVALN